MAKLKKRQTKGTILSLVFSAQELALVTAAPGKYQQFSEWIRGVALARAQNGNAKPQPGERNGSRLRIKKVRISKAQATLFGKAARAHRLTLENWLRDLALDQVQHP